MTADCSPGLGVLSDQDGYLAKISGYRSTIALVEKSNAHYQGKCNSTHPKSLGITPLMNTPHSLSCAASPLRQCFAKAPEIGLKKSGVRVT